MALAKEASAQATLCYMTTYWGHSAPHSSPFALLAHVYCGQTYAHLSNSWALVKYPILQRWCEYRPQWHDVEIGPHAVDQLSDYLAAEAIKCHINFLRPAVVKLFDHLLLTVRIEYCIQAWRPYL